MISKMQEFPFDGSHKGTLATIIFSFLGWLDINSASQVIFMLATITTGTLTSLYTYKKIKHLDNEKTTKKH